jgi:ribosomal protein S12 methylthiotransferase
MQLHLINLGCARNQVDSEIMAGRLARAGHDIVDDPGRAETIIVNTCCFVEDAADESVDAILAAADYKQSGRCRRLIVTGCLPERYREASSEALPEVDLFLGTGAYDQILAAVEEALPPNTKIILPDPDRITPQAAETPRDPAAGPMAYIKIAEGCDRHCTFCIIPTLRGRQKSRPLAAIVAEAQHLIAHGVKELVLVAQETTRYGHDREDGDNLSVLLAALSDLSPDIWVRFLYAHPQSLSDDVLDTVAERANLCAYFDIPIQHSVDRLLKQMGRRYTAANLAAMLARIRRRAPEAVLRTTLIVGFPGETDADFEQLLQFVQAARFDHLGVFTFSDADDLAAHGLPHPVAPETARQRRDILMEAQKAISESRLARYLDRELTVLVEEAPEPDVFLGRTAFQAPEVDGLTYIHAAAVQNTVAVGRFVQVRITDTLEYDLVGEPV